MTITISQKENSKDIEKKINSMLQQRKDKKLKEKEQLMQEVLDKKLFQGQDPLLIQKQLRDERN